MRWKSPAVNPRSTHGRAGPASRRRKTRATAVANVETEETGVSSGRRSLEPAVSPRRQTDILLLRLWHGCQGCVKISAQLPLKASPI